MRHAMSFPLPHHAGRIQRAGTTLTYHALASDGTLVRATRAVGTVAELRALVRARMAAFGAASLGARESEALRADRKYLAAHPLSVLRSLWAQASPDEQMELEMMLSPASHHGVSDPAWVQAHQTPVATVAALPVAAPAPAGDGPEGA